MRIYLLTLCSLLFALPMAASAATISFRATPANPGVGDTVRVDVLLDSALPVNAFSGSLHYSPAAVEPATVSDGNSIVSMWITHPAVTGASTPIPFAGITPGGFSGNKGILFSVLFHAKVAGKVKFSLDALEVLRNDGAGGNEPTMMQPFILTIGAKSSGGYIEPADQTPPESFTPVLGTDPQLFDGKTYLVFSTLDKGSGVDHYTVAESRLPAFLLSLFPLTWRVTTSPYALADQNLTSAVYVKAVDRSGNERLNIYPPQHLLSLYEKIALLVILVLVGLLWQKGRRGRRLRKNL